MSFWREELDAILRDAGVAEELVSSIDINPNMAYAGEVPYLRLPAGWDPHAADDADLVREAVQVGVGLEVEATDDFDLSWLGDDLKYLRLLWCGGNQDAYRGWGALAKMESLVALRTPRIARSVDVSGLEHLLWARIEGPGLLSVADAPELKSLVVDEARIPPGTRFSPSLEALSIDGREIASLELRRLDRLVRLSLHDTPALDLTPVGEIDNLEILGITSCGSLTGLDALTRNSRLRELDLYNVRSIDRSTIILTLPLTAFRAQGCPTLDDEFKAMATRACLINRTVCG